MGNKNILIICSSVHHGNTMKIAKAIGNILDAEIIEPKNFDKEVLCKYKLIGFGSGIYNGKHNKSIFTLVNNLEKQTKKKAFIFSTAALPVKVMHRYLRKSLVEKGFEVMGEFCCRGFMDYSFTKYIYGGLNKGKPNNEDLKSAYDFARELRKSI